MLRIILQWFWFVLWWPWMKVKVRSGCWWQWSNVYFSQKIKHFNFGLWLVPLDSGINSEW